MTQTEFENLLLVLTVGCTALGGVILAALLIKGWRSYALPMLFGLIAGVLIEPVLAPLLVNPPRAKSLAIVLTCAGVALLARLIAELFLEKLLSEFRTGESETLVPERWTDPANVTMHDHVKRWFVTIAAATGAVVGAVSGIDSFWTTSARTTLAQLVHISEEPRSIVLALLLLGVSLFLIGPIQSYVFETGAGTKEPSDPAKKFYDLFAKGFNWSAMGRFGLIILAYAQLYLLTNGIGATIKDGSSRVVYTIFAAATTPAIVSYYWSAALQRRVPSVREATVKPCLHVGAIMSYGIALLIVVMLVQGEFDDAMLRKSQADMRNAGMLLFFSPVLAILPAFVLSVLTTLAYCVAGGFAIDHFTGRYTMLYVAAALLIAAVAQQAVLLPLAWLLGFELDKLRFATFIGGILGWVIGLWASGFPKLLTIGRAKSD
jgi:hypothetical protein